MISCSPIPLPARRALLCVAIACAWLLLCSPVTAQAADRLTEDEVKASYLYNFVKYVDWPAPRKDTSTLTICIVGRSPLNELIESLAGKTVRGRRLVVRQYVRPEELRECDIVFVNASARMTVAQLVAACGTHPVLTVGDGKGFAAGGGIIGFGRVGDKIRFEINNQTALRVRLHISSHLLRLATNVVE